MNLEQQVCSLDLAKKLKKLGVKQESVFRWITGDRSNEYYKRNEVFKVQCTDGDGQWVPDHWEEVCAAFTVAELVELLTVANTDIIVALQDINADHLAKKLIYEITKS